MASLHHDVFLPLSTVVVLLFLGCAPTRPITEAVCVSQCLDSWEHSRVLVWSNDPKVEPLLADWARKQDAEVIEPAIVQDAIRRHHVVIEPEPGVENVLRDLGRLVGANRVLFAAVIRQSRPLTIMYSGYKEGHPRVTTLFDPIVTVRSLAVDAPITHWSVSATGASSTFVLDPTVADLTQTALRRASCEADRLTHRTDESGCD
jgi:hypothetical protein